MFLVFSRPPTSSTYTLSLHDALPIYGQNDALRANGFSNNANGIRRQPFKQHNYGGSAGGPIYIPKLYDGRNRSFWFVDRKSTRLNSSHPVSSYAVFCLKKKKRRNINT